MIKLYYFHDPMCSWCYAFDRVLRQVESNLPESVCLIKRLGGLAADSTVPMPAAMQEMVLTNWQRVEQTVPHIQFNYDFWRNNQPYRSTFPACRAVLAAKKQGAIYENKMTNQIQQAYYQQAKNPSLDETLSQCARAIGLDVVRFNTDYNSLSIDRQLQQQIKLTHLMGVSSYPSLRLKVNQKILTINIDYNNEQCMLNQISHYSTRR